MVNKTNSDEPVSNFFKSIIDRYLLLLDNVFSLSIFVLITLTVIFEAMDKPGPIEWILTAVKSILDDTTQPKYILAVASLIYKIMIVLNKPMYKKFLVQFGMYFIAYFQDPDYSNFVGSLLAVVTVALLSNWTILELYILGQFWFVFTGEKLDSYKLYIVILAILVLFTGWVDLDFKFTSFKERKI